ncbi:2-dehydro-3-deoxygalactonokinase (plasmid) [Deinococcus radiomollis]|uniref:2-dehydro-3-deoxygalactonokinase n=1 Tax=Deinococcus radiomollis TaxID=468916 RepID=UPI0038921420
MHDRAETAGLPAPTAGDGPATEHSAYAVIDSGTTRTRLRIWQGHTVVWEEKRRVGAARTASEGPGPLTLALGELLDAARQQATLRAVIASGMITSNVGLFEVPHLSAPASYQALAAGIRRHALSGLGEMFFIPGVKTLPGAHENLYGDVLRGEEVEVVGLRELLGLHGEVSFVHYGSHHKLVRTDDHGLLGSLTTLGGELLGALLGHTILVSGTAALSTLGPPDPEWWNRGWMAAEQSGFARAAFSGRLAGQLLGAAPEQVTAFLLGAVSQQDAILLAGTAPLVLYGHASFTEPVAGRLRRQGRDVSVVSPELSERAAALGAVRLFEGSPYA